MPVSQFQPPAAFSSSNDYAAWAATAPHQRLVRVALSAGPIGAEEVEVAVEHCGLCHSDLSISNNDWGNTHYPIILGHEIVGRVTAVGPNTKGVALGERVGIGWNSSSCMHCRQCMSGRQHLCAQVQPTVFGRGGGFASHVRSHWAWVIPIPKDLDSSEAGPLLCAGITVFAPLAAHAKAGDRVGIIGIGGLGHLAVQFAAASGCEVTAFTSHENKFPEAKWLGAHYVVSSTDSAAIRKLRGRFDLLLSTVNVQLEWGAVIDTLAPNGRLHLLGPVPEPIPVLAFALIHQQRSISGSLTGSPSAIADMLQFAARHRLTPRNEHYPMRKIDAAFERLASGAARYRVVLDADF